MSEWVMIALLTLGPLCWMLGGMGFKWVRRFLWPLLAGALLMNADFITIPLLIIITLMIVNSLPYGETYTWFGKGYSMPWWMRWWVLSSYGIPVLFLDEKFGAGWILGIGVVLTCLMALSRRWGRVTHKLFEFSAGALQAAGLILGALR